MTKLNPRYAITPVERIAMIKEIAERKRTMETLKDKSKNLQKKVEVNREFVDVFKEQDNIYAYTDQSQYAKEHYGETLYETRRFYKDWD